MTSAFLALLAMLPTNQARAENKAVTERREAVRRLAIQMAEFLRTQSQLQRASELANANQIKRIEESIYKMRTQALDLASELKDFESKESRTNLAETVDTNRISHGDYDKLERTLGIAVLTGLPLLGAAVGGYEAAIHPDPGPLYNSFIPGAMLGLIAGGFLDIPAAALVYGYTHTVAGALEKLFVKMTSPGSEVFFEELKNQGINVPDKNRAEWLSLVIANARTELIVQDTPATIELRINHLNAAIAGAAAALAGDPNLAAVFSSLAGNLPKTKGFRRKFRPKIWGREAYVKFVLVRNEFARLCEKYKLSERGYSFEQDYQHQVNEALAASIKTKASDVFTADSKDHMTRKFLESGDESLLTSEILRLFQSATEPFQIALKATELEPVARGVRDLALWNLETEITLKQGMAPLKFSVHFFSQIAKKNNGSDEGHLDRVIAEGNWREPLEQSLNMAIETSPSTRELVKTRVQLDACEAQVKGEAAQAREAQEEMAIRASKNAASGS